MEKRRWTGNDILQLVADAGERGVLLGGVTAPDDREALREMARRGWIALTEFGVPHARITDRGREILASPPAS